MTEQAITVTDSEITIQAQYFCRRDNTCANKDVLGDVFARQYSGQVIIIRALDGENLIATGLLTLIYEFCTILNISLDSVKVVTHDTSLTQPFVFEHLPLGLFLGANKFIPEFERNLDQAKFVGTAVGRFTLDRLILAYELDQAFPGDNYIIFQGRHWSDQARFSELYKSELTWLQDKKFDQDIDAVTPVGSVGFQAAYKHYPDIWNHYQIEVVAETDAVSDFWFTEKTAKCLATGKPFLLSAGYHSLANLRSKGFETFGSIIDETYDDEFLPTKRTGAIIKSLETLYNDPTRSKKIAEMYEIAKRNQEHYKKYVINQGHSLID